LYPALDAPTCKPWTDTCLRPSGHNGGLDERAVSRESMAQAPRQVRLAGAPLERSRHVCAFFNNADEAYGMLVPLIHEGLDRGEHAFHIVDPALRVAHLERLTESGIDAAGALRSGQLEVRAWEEAYLRGQRFGQSAMLALVEKV